MHRSSVVLGIGPGPGQGARGGFREKVAQIWSWRMCGISLGKRVCDTWREQRGMN